MLSPMTCWVKLNKCPLMNTIYGVPYIICSAYVCNSTSIIIHLVCTHLSVTYVYTYINSGYIDTLLMDIYRNLQSRGRETVKVNNK